MADGVILKSLLNSDTSFCEREEVETESHVLTTLTILMYKLIIVVYVSKSKTNQLITLRYAHQSCDKLSISNSHPELLCS